MNKLISVGVLAFVAPWLNAAVLEATNFGGKPDGKTENRQAINKAIDAAAAAGGGTGRVRPGTWLTGSIHMRSNVTLLLDRGADHRSEFRGQRVRCRRNRTSGTSSRTSGTAIFTTA